MKSIFVTAFAALCISCSTEVRLTVENPSEFPRYEVVEISWEEITSRLANATPENIVVKDSDGSQVPSQVIYHGGEIPVSLIFRSGAEAKKSTRYSLATGLRENYPVKAYGRYVPERMDDYAWENDKMAYRLYGPALTEPDTPGIDVWCKKTEDMVIDRWYAAGDYHKDTGEGMDCYKVGETLGCGGSTPVYNGRLVMSGKYITYKTLDNGPVRTSFELTYGPYVAGGVEVHSTKVISLDAGDLFNKITDTYYGNFESLPVAAGIVKHDLTGGFMDETFPLVGIMEWASDSQQPQEDGLIALAVIMQGGRPTMDLENHAAIVKDLKPGVPSTYWAGATWSKKRGGMEFPKEWEVVVKSAAIRLLAEEPLKVTFK